MPDRQTLTATLDRLLGAEPGVCVFDADGTLWDADASEELLDWVDKRQLITPPAGSESLLAYSDELCAVDRARGYGWAAQAYAGVDLGRVLEWAEACFVERVEPGIKGVVAAIVERFHAAHWEVYVVSGSPWWAVLPGAERLGITRERVLAVEVEIDDGRLTDRLTGGVTSSQGKVARIKAKIGRTPAFACGNTIDDVPMLRLATHHAVVVDPIPLPDDATDLAAIARSHGWSILRTRPV